MTPGELIDNSLELVAKRCPDLTGPVYAALARRHPDAWALLEPVAPVVRGRMLMEVLYAFSTRPAQTRTVDNYLTDEGGVHLGFGVAPGMHRALLDAILDTLAEILAADWNPATAAAWQHQAEAMLAALERGQSLAVSHGIGAAAP